MLDELRNLGVEVDKILGTLNGKQSLYERLIFKFYDLVKKSNITEDNLEEILKVYQNGFYSDKKRFAIESKKILEKLNGAIKDKVDNVIETLTNIRKKLKLKNNQEIAEEVVTQIRENVEKNFKGFKQVTNILVGVFITLPLTCTALNWVYPRFMEVFFPNLANSKKSDAPEEKVGGNK